MQETIRSLMDGLSIVPPADWRVALVQEQAQLERIRCADLLESEFGDLTDKLTAAALTLRRRGAALILSGEALSIRCATTTHQGTLTVTVSERPSILVPTRGLAHTRRLLARLLTELSGRQYIRHVDWDRLLAPVGF